MVWIFTTFNEGAYMTFKEHVQLNGRDDKRQSTYTVICCMPIVKCPIFLPETHKF